MAELCIRVCCSLWHVTRVGIWFTPPWFLLLGLGFLVGCGWLLACLLPQPLSARDTDALDQCQVQPFIVQPPSGWRWYACQSISVMLFWHERSTPPSRMESCFSSSVSNACQPLTLRRLKDAVGLIASSLRTTLTRELRHIEPPPSLTPRIGSTPLSLKP